MPLKQCAPIIAAALGLLTVSKGAESPMQPLRWGLSSFLSEQTRSIGDPRCLSRAADFLEHAQQRHRITEVEPDVFRRIRGLKGVRDAGFCDSILGEHEEFKSNSLGSRKASTAFFWSKDRKYMVAQLSSSALDSGL